MSWRARREDEDGAAERPMVDFLFNLLIMMLVVWILPKMPETRKNEGDVELQGVLMFILRWNPDVNVDLDLWVLDPEDRQIGFSSRGSAICSLTFDDTGKTSDPYRPENNEQIICRRTYPNDHYRVAVHTYSVKEHGIEAKTGKPLTAQMEILYQPPDGDRITRIYAATFEIEEVANVEYAVASFAFDEEGKFDGESLIVEDTPITPPGIRSDAPVVPIPLQTQSGSSAFGNAGRGSTLEP